MANRHSRFVLVSVPASAATRRRPLTSAITRLDTHFVQSYYQDTVKIGVLVTLRQPVIMQ